MNKYLQNLAALLAIALLGWGAYYVMAPAPQTETNRNLTLSTPVIADKTVKSEETALPLITASKQKTAGSTSPAPSGEMHLSQPHSLNGKISVPESDPVDLSTQNMSIKKEETKSKEILPGVTIKGGGVNVNLDKDDSRTLEVRPRSQTELTLKQKF